MPKFRRSPTLVAALAVLVLCFSAVACNQSSPTLPQSASSEQMRSTSVAVEPGDDPSPDIDSHAANDD